MRLCPVKSFFLLVFSWESQNTQCALWKSLRGGSRDTRSQSLRVMWFAECDGMNCYKDSSVLKKRHFSNTSSTDPNSHPVQDAVILTVSLGCSRAAQQRQAQTETNRKLPETITSWTLSCVCNDCHPPRTTGHLCPKHISSVHNVTISPWNWRLRVIGCVSWVSRGTNGQHYARAGKFWDHLP